MTWRTPGTPPSRSLPRFLSTALGIALLIGAAATDAAAQQPARGRLRVVDTMVTQIVRTRDGSMLVGRVVALDSVTARFEMRFGTVDVPLAEIEEVQEVGRLVTSPTGALWLPDPNTTRMFFAPTGRQLARGEGYFSDYLLFFPGFAYGITDRITIGGGMSIFPTGPENQLIYLTPKVGVIQREKLNVAVGALVVSLPTEVFDDSDNAIGLLYSVGTWGRPDASVTFGLGYGFRGGRLSDTPALVFGGTMRGTRRSALVTENYYIPGSGGLLSGGVRFIGERMAVDFGLVAFAADEDLSPPIPFVGFIVNF